MSPAEALSALVVGVPHAGVAVPYSVRKRLLPHVDEAFLRTQSDGWTDRIYDIPGARAVVYPWSRVVADPNRAEDQFTEGGVLPTTDFDERPLYAQGREPTTHEHLLRVLEYHRPYHEQVAAAVADPRTRFYIDAHSMMQTAPLRSPDYGRARPDSVLGNRPSSKTTEFGPGDRLCCSEELSEFARQRLSYWLLEIHAPPGPPGSEPAGSVNLNDPFPGGYGVGSHTDPDRGLQGLQVELNQRLWVTEENFVAIPGRIEWMADVIAVWTGELMEAVVSR